MAARAFGPAKLKEGLALGRFKRFAEAPEPAKLDDHMRDAFGSLFRKPDDAGGQSTPEGFGLQATINDLARDSFGDGFKPIKEDGWIGPKTRDAFARLLPKTGAETFTRKLRHSLGFFG